MGQGFVIEFVMTCQLIFAVFMLAGEKHKGTFLAPFVSGCASCVEWTELTLSFNRAGRRSQSAPC